MDYENIINLISNVGFPIFVVVWLLLRSDKRQEEMTASFIELKKAVDVICRVCEKKWNT